MSKQQILGITLSVSASSYVALLLALTSCQQAPTVQIADQHQGVPQPQVMGQPPEPDTADTPPAVPPTPPETPARPEPAKPISKPVSVSRLIAPTPDTDRFLNNKAFITKWQLLGPIRFARGQFKDEHDVIHYEFVPGEKNLTGAEAGPNGMQWQAASFDGKNSPGEIDLDHKLDEDAKNNVVYAVANLWSPEDLKGLSLYVGCDEYIKIWLNGRLVHAYNRNARIGKWDQDVIEDLSLKKGFNRVVVKTVDMQGRWNFYLRFATKDGIPISVSN